ncbi:alpha/beta-hydrolase [Guyanagaster necrorhizus]|uniref:Carboxylic ester hydrolase n=1 Tax=Guyanagaster necrorhizus TaxID=856835 RepID=A0A9P7VWW5_9AGAR|nr:alpha/beta-hydrolase [Guyanagaster necrorhizus MCA 3950]KAG7448210.1 alpha/beta-hydrolase [Guyanagaster necrorhizus MCA 3950]
MVALIFVLSALSLVSATPFPGSSHNSIFVKPSRDILCILLPWLCPRDTQITTEVETSIGTAKGVANGTAVRFPVKYASAERWQDSAVASEWELPNNSSDVTAMPLACPQSDLDSSEYAEDCLSMVLYVPATLTVSDNVPTLTWVHGGSFITGSASDEGLDGSNLASTTNSIVAVIQYRLGGLGFMAPNGSVNLAVKDVINAIKFLQTILPSFGGDTSKITLAGQSSGASMIRALLAVPSASSLFQSAILQSDPMNFGFLNTSTQETMQSYFNGLISCGASDTTCWDALSLDDILNAQSTLFSDAASLDASTGTAEPIRPVRDGTLITSPLDSTAAFPSVSKPILITSVLNEAGLTIYGSFTVELAAVYFEAVADEFLGDERAEVIANSTFYTATDEDDDTRIRLERLGTDWMWKCAIWTFARNWVSNGGAAYVGLYTVGASYPLNTYVDFCHEEGKVCHRDDIEIVFGTVSNPSSTQSELISEMQQRYKAFLHSGNPNVDGLTTWTASGTSEMNALQLGESGEFEIGACIPSFWGEAVEYDYQVYGI